MPDRIIRDELLESDRWLAMPRNTHRLGFVCLLLQADALGNMEASEGRLWRLWREPLRLDNRNAIAEILESMVAQDLIRLYDVDGKRFIHIPRYGQRLRYIGRISPLSPWTTTEQKQKLDSKNTGRKPGDSQESAGSAPAEVKRSRSEVEVKRREENPRARGKPPTNEATATAPITPAIKTVLDNLTGKSKPASQSKPMTREEQIAYVNAVARGKP